MEQDASTTGAERIPRVLSLFSGCGGMDLGLEAAGFSTIGCVEMDLACRETLRANRPDWRLLAHDALDFASRVSPHDLGVGFGELDVIAAGPPCQPFSVAGQWAGEGPKGLSDPRARTVDALLDIVERLAPRFVVIENVKGFFGGRNSAARHIGERLEQINRSGGWAYAATTFALNAADYGVAQRRERVFAVIDRLGSEVAPPPATHATDPITAWEAIGDLANCVDEYPSGGTWAGLLPSIPEGGNYQYLTARGGGPELFGYRTRYWSFLLKLARDQPSWTIPASPGPDTGPFHWDNRHLTVRERLRIQSFPDSWTLSGSLRAKVRQVGNATPPALAEAVGRQLFDLLLEQPRPRTGALHRSRRRDIPAPVLPIPVSSDYAQYAGPKFAHPGTGAGPGRKRLATPSQSH